MSDHDPAGALRLAALGALVCAGILVLTSRGGEESPRAGGPVVVTLSDSSLPPVGEVQLIADGALAIGRHGDGVLYVLRLRCPLLPCPVGWREDRGEFGCSCHGERFAADGTLLEGLGPTHLERHALRVVRGPHTPASGPLRIDRRVRFVMVGREVPPDRQYPESLFTQ